MDFDILPYFLPNPEISLNDIAVMTFLYKLLYIASQY